MVLAGRPRRGRIAWAGNKFRSLRRSAPSHIAASPEPSHRRLHRGQEIPRSIDLEAPVERLKPESHSHVRGGTIDAKTTEDDYEDRSLR
jgi:hypothetical protein